MVPKPLRGLQAERVEAHVHARRAQRHVGEDLRLAAGEQRRTVYAWGDVNLALDRSDLVLGATVGALLLDRDRLADRVLLDLVERGDDLGPAPGVGVVGLGRVLGDDLVLDLVDRLVALELALGGDRVDQGLAVGGSDVADQTLVDARGLDLQLFLAGLALQLVHRRAEQLDLAVGNVKCVEDLLPR